MECLVCAAHTSNDTLALTPPVGECKEDDLMQADVLSLPTNVLGPALVVVGAWVRAICGLLAGALVTVPI